MRLCSMKEVSGGITSIISDVDTLRSKYVST